MSKPPITPTNSPNGKVKVSYFERLGYEVKKALKDENSNIDINFEGFRDLLTTYRNLGPDDFNTAWELARDFNLWSEYFSGIANLFQKEYLNAEADKKEIQATASFDADTTKVANGDRLSNKDARVVASRKKRNMYKAFYDELTAKIQFLERAHYQCKTTYDMNKNLREIKQL